MHSLPLSLSLFSLFSFAFLLHLRRLKFKVWKKCSVYSCMWYVGEMSVRHWQETGQTFTHAVCEFEFLLSFLLCFLGASLTELPWKCILLEVKECRWNRMQNAPDQGVQVEAWRMEWREARSTKRGDVSFGLCTLLNWEREKKETRERERGEREGKRKRCK